MAVRKNTETPENIETPKTTREAVPEVTFQSVDFDPAMFAARVSVGRTGAGRPRTEYMQQLDALLKQKHADGSVAALECLADEKTVAALEKKITNSAQYTKLGLRFGSYVKSKNEGMVYVTFKVVDQTKRPRKPKQETDSE